MVKTDRIFSGFFYEKQIAIKFCEAPFSNWDAFFLAQPPSPPQYFFPNLECNFRHKGLFVAPLLKNVKNLHESVIICMKFDIQFEWNFGNFVYMCVGRGWKSFGYLYRRDGSSDCLVTLVLICRFFKHEQFKVQKKLFIVFFHLVSCSQ